ncbi:prostamide/prostaglandin F synthase-like [Neocloeon triangulifer]|uniref:prostamide/prostaglandin F synthase-like n=1 Tax=Neocloeon triangulifer TaxID=2078957 RepID=UPI00286F9CF1|nr:prostamide/prostaglandin F synthase-like [Neocloeon triangulifer]
MKYYILALLFLLLAWYVVREDSEIPIEMEIKNVASNLIKNVASGESVAMSTLWETQPTVVVFFRRWGCLFCRLWAHDLKQIAPILKENNVRLVGVGPEDIGVEDFVAGKFFDGELYIDTEKKSYNGLGFKRFNWFSVMASLITKTARDAMGRGKANNLGGDMRGDALQNGGALVVGTGGKLLYSFRQEGPADQVPNSTILGALGIKVPEGVDVDQKSQPDAQCTKDAK